MPRVDIAIQHHPLRAEMAAELLGCVPGARIVTDPAPQDRWRSAWRTYRACLESAAAGASHVLVIQDDVLVCDGFEESVAAAVAARPDRVIAFFVGGNPYEHRRRIREAHGKRWSWAELDNQRWCPAVGTCWPVDRIAPLLAWHDAQKFPAAFTADDEILGRFLRHSGELPLATVPSLLEHPDTVPSIANNRRSDGRDAGRRAALWVGDCGFCDARQIDWAAGPGA